MSDLKDYANIIGIVFKQLSELLYHEGDSGDCLCSINDVLDPDTCAEIIEVANTVSCGN